METSNKSGSKSLKTVALKMIMLVMTLLLLVTTLISFAFYIYTYLRSYKHELDILSSYAFANLDHDYLEELFDKTKEIYESIPEEVRKDPFTEEYKGYFGHLLDDKYHEERAELIKCRENSDISNIYLGFYDTEKDRLVIVLDGDKGELYYIPGQYIDNTNGYLEKWERIQKIIKSDWFMSFAHTSLIGFSATDYFAIYTEEGGPLVGLVAIDTNLEYFADELLTYLAMVIPALLIAFGILATIYSRIMDRMVISQFISWQLRPRLTQTGIWSMNRDIPRILPTLRVLLHMNLPSFGTPWLIWKKRSMTQFPRSDGSVPKKSVWLRRWTSQLRYRDLHFPRLFPTVRGMIFLRP
ncbi:MAG: hypothetical protein J5959_08770 [Butyrivibrio sp.]|nr:hypothetical protein [Butyrivibrio sp.]